MNNDNEVARQIIEWLKIDGVPYRIRRLILIFLGQ
jgi:hypothetical protein